MMRRSLVFLSLVAAVTLPLTVRAQSLADVARAEEARRKTVKQPAKVYTNSDLRPSTDPVPAPTAAQAVSAAPGTGAPVAAPAPTTAGGADGGKKDEKYWKDRMTQARDALDRDKVLADAVQSRINALTTDFVNTSDPAQRAVVQANRTLALAELDRLNKDVQRQTKSVSDIQEDARKAGVPAGWLR